MSAIYIAGIALCSVLAQWVAWAFRVPAILFLLLTGLILGPFSGVLEPDALLGDLLFPVVSLSVAVILFEGSLTLHFRELKGIGKVVRNLCSIGMITTCLVVSLSAYWILELNWRVAAVLGAVLVVTGPTVIAPLLNSMRPTQDIDRILRWEGIVIDPIGALFAVLVFEAVMLVGQGEVLSHTIIALFKTLGVGLTIGVVAGWLTTLLIRREWLPFELHKFGILALVLISFTVSNHLSHESGLLAVTVFGIWLANQDELEIDSVLEFKEDLSMILISSLFILLAARLQLSDLMMLHSDVFIFLAIVLFVARPACIAISTFKTDLPLKSRLVLSWIAPRGIVAAAVGSVFALSMVEAGIADAEKIVPLIFTVIIVTVVLQSLTATPLAKLLKVRQPAPNTILIIGANHVARAIACGLKDQNIPVHLSDPAWENCKMARMDGLPCYYGNPQSEHAERYLPLTTIRSVLALSPNRHHNALGVQYFSHLLDEKDVFSLRSSTNHAKANKDSATFLSRQILFGDNGAYARLSSLIAKGGKVSATRISEEFSWEQYKEINSEAIPLFILSGEKNDDDDSPIKIRPFTTSMEKTPQVGERIVALQPPKLSVLKDPNNGKPKESKEEK
ncbi:sodium:proton antiporter [Pseudoalteromonas shioyasakiensis]|uniref:cation:proton antiporter n=1 Tax=Pseudoalteromonas TaxID=53246 RepID=UPI000C928EC6|nr:MULTISPECIES: sodium:proton antiporter [Pseudoalteromonas]MAD04894.1 sodium:proton exchanger [Pseudoalteromonas sp.]MCG9708484.1 sodium:proton antiporter [Pseudoalteromonas sp. Isolate3]MCQ8883534.1 sodium:proton antiporter [Pseudoalteromonas shioyasakiensis]NIZ06097.1 sodium:proton antiporter [Pseudoalteromonas sp. HF66]QLE07619.1 sodium:proton antiporter [Pseudoalteromonas shioyasakiensis]|tara:strand:+ start:3478 stop:5337 length:1860 start_codon:yes stop_codon:yes gene_type:complete